MTTDGYDWVEIVDPNSHHTFFANPVIIQAACYATVNLTFSLFSSQSSRQLGNVFGKNLSQAPCKSAFVCHSSPQLLFLSSVDDGSYFRKSSDPDGDWWELWDDKTNLPYYYHTHTCATEWTKPMDKQVVSLIKIQVIWN